MKKPDKKYLIPKTLDEAISLAIQQKDNFTYLAGGTDVMIHRLQENNISPTLIDLLFIPQLRTIKTDKNYIKIGATVTLDAIIKNKYLRSHLPVLVESARSVASPLIQKTATIAGNILCETRCEFFNQSEFWRRSNGYCLKCDGTICHTTGGKKTCFSVFISDIAPVLICLNAQIEYIDAQGTYVIPVEDIYSGDGVKPIKLQKEAIITQIIIPVKNNSKTFFKKLRPRNSIDFTNLTVAMRFHNTGEFKISLTGVDSKPVTFITKDISDPENLIRQINRKCRIVDNLFFPRIYRKEMVSVFLKKGFEELNSELNNF